MKKEIKQAIQLLNEKGYEAYLVGGATRNYLLHKTITDYDITTNADPNAIKMCFSNYPKYDIGKKYGTVVVSINKVKIDITPYRKEDIYIDHRHPEDIVYTSSLKEDLQRRDFTINALCMDKDENIIDLFNGINDLNNKIIRAIGNPDTRFHEDALRILRAIRFKAKLKFAIEDKTNKAIHKNKELLNYISIERKQEELLNILSCKNAYQIINEYLPIINTFLNIKTIDRKINDFSNPIYSLAYILSKNEKGIIKQLNLSISLIHLIEYLIKISSIDISNDYNLITCLSSIYKKDVYQYLCELHHIDLQDRYNKIEKYIVLENELLIDGNTIKSYGYEGKQISTIKNRMLDEIHHKRLLNRKTSLLKYLERIKI